MPLMHLNVNMLIAEKMDLTYYEMFFKEYHQPFFLFPYIKANLVTSLVISYSKLWHVFRLMVMDGKGQIALMTVCVSIQHDKQ